MPNLFFGLVKSKPSISLTDYCTFLCYVKHMNLQMYYKCRLIKMYFWLLVSNNFYKNNLPLMEWQLIEIMCWI
jgi:hypothetical protein